MLRAGGDVLAGVDLICPVPLHWSRLFKRRYNQSAILAGHVGALADIDCVPDLLTRTRRTKSQGLMKRADRLGNVRGAFAVNPARDTLVPGRTILLVDDVLTTGATVENCAQTLLKAGAGVVNVLTLARVVLPNRAAN